MNNEIEIASSSEVETKSPAKPKIKRLTPKKERIPFHKKKRIHVAGKYLKGYHAHCFTDEDGKVERALEGGYEFIDAAPEKGNRNAQDPSRFGKVMCQSVGQGKMGYVMRIPKELWHEDQAEKQKELDSVDRRMGLDRLPAEARHCFRGKIEIDNSRK